MFRLNATVAALFLAALSASADDGHTITVRGKGTSRAKPDKLILVLGASGKAEKAADAIDKLDKKTTEIKDQLAKALEERSKEKGQIQTAMRDTGLSFGPSGADMERIIMMGGGNQENAAEVSVSTELEMTVSGVDQMSEADLRGVISLLVDKAVEAGAELKAPTNRFNWMQQQQSAEGVYFGFSDVEKHTEKAWDEAVAKAKERAGAIAKRLGLEVGTAVKVRDVSSGAEGSKSMNPYTAMWGMGGSDDGGPKIKSSGETELSVEIEVEFELLKK